MLSFLHSSLVQEAVVPEPEGPRPDNKPSTGPPVGLRRREHAPRDSSPASQQGAAEEQPERQRDGISSRRPLPAGPHHTGGSHAGSALLIVVLTLALATLIFRRVYLAQDYKFDYDL